MLTPEQIENNKGEFIALIKCIERDFANIEGLINKLNDSDFFIAPASAKYHAAYEGGLCQHSLNVYYNLMQLIKDKFPDNPFPMDSILIVSLLHDISKMNYYEKTCFNKKVYDEMGNSKDDLGRFDWVTINGYKIKDNENRFLYGNHEINSEFMIRQFIPLSVQESVAILHHMAGMSNDCAKDDITAIYNRYPLALLLHLADMLSTYCDEKI